jgi:hypothetical protein
LRVLLYTPLKKRTEYEVRRFKGGGLQKAEMERLTAGERSRENLKRNIRFPLIQNIGGT